MTYYVPSYPTCESFSGDSLDDAIAHASTCAPKMNLTVDIFKRGISSKRVAHCIADIPDGSGFTARCALEDANELSNLKDTIMYHVPCRDLYTTNLKYATSTAERCVSPFSDKTVDIRVHGNVVRTCQWTLDDAPNPLKAHSFTCTETG